MSYGCYNRPPLNVAYFAFDGYESNRRTKPRTVLVNHTMSRDCQYAISTPDPRCSGCKHEAKR